jgi:predicted metal-dependent hydrolase
MTLEHRTKKTPPDVDAAVLEARRLWNERRFWHVHEALETIWRVKTGDEKRWLQGLILAAASLVHLEKKHDSVTWRMMGDALARLHDAPADYHGWDVARFRLHMAQCIGKNLWTEIKV